MAGGEVLISGKRGMIFPVKDVAGRVAMNGPRIVADSSRSDRVLFAGAACAQQGVDFSKVQIKTTDPATTLIC
jgi:hypothetical protein